MTFQTSEITSDNLSGGLDSDILGTIYGYLTSGSADAGNGDDQQVDLSGQVVQLLDLSGNVVAETATDADGKYVFDVPAGDYVVALTLDDGYSVSGQYPGGAAGDAAIQIETVSLQAGQLYAAADVAVTYDAGTGNGNVTTVPNRPT